MTDLGIPGIGPGTEIGRGGHAVVYRAAQIDLSRIVAVKMLLVGHDDAARRRFDRERRLLARMQHPNVTPVLDSGYSVAGEPYVIMPLYERSLDAVGALPWNRVVDLMAQVADGVGYAHSQGVLHRDLKPGNVMLNDDRPVVIDFGIATVSDALATRSLGLRLTPAYAPPEAFDEHDPDELLDVYALGATAHALLSGRPPFSQDEPGLGAIIKRINTEPPADLRTVAPEAVCEVIERAMAKRPEDRQRSAAEFAEALRSTAAASTITAPARSRPAIEPSTETQVAPRLGRRRFLAGAAALAVLAGAGAAGVQLTGDRTPDTFVVAEATIEPETGAAATATPGPTADTVLDAGQPTGAPTPVPEPTLVPPARPGPIPDSIERVGDGFVYAMEHIGVDGELPARRQVCPGVLGWCLNDSIDEVIAALGAKPGVPLPDDSPLAGLIARSWLLPSGNMLSTRSDAAGNLVWLEVTAAPGTRVSLLEDPDLGTLNLGHVEDRWGPQEPLDGFATSWVTHCFEATTETHVRYEFAEFARQADTAIDSYQIYFETVPEISRIRDPATGLNNLPVCS